MSVARQDQEAQVESSSDSAAELEELVSELRTSHEQRRALHALLVASQEEERQQIAMDIHDDTIQAMTAAGMRMAAFRRHLPQEREPREAFSQIEGVISDSIARLRHLLFELHPPALAHPGGLRTVLREHLNRLGENSGARVAFEERVSEEPSAETRAICHRIALEALTNVGKHAGASGVDVLVESREGGVFIRVRDDGAGFSPAESGDGLPGHLGLLTMRERAELSGGWLRLDTAPGAGTTVEFWIPN